MINDDLNIHTEGLNKKGSPVPSSINSHSVLLSIDGVTELTTISKSSTALPFSSTQSSGSWATASRSTSKTVGNGFKIFEVELKEIFDKCLVVVEDEENCEDDEFDYDSNDLKKEANKEALADVASLSRYIRWKLGSNDLADTLLSHRSNGTLHGFISWSDLLAIAALYIKEGSPPPPQPSSPLLPLPNSIDPATDVTTISTTRTITKQAKDYNAIPVAAIPQVHWSKGLTKTDKNNDNFDDSNDDNFDHDYDDSINSYNEQEVRTRQQLTKNVSSISLASMDDDSTSTDHIPSRQTNESIIFLSEPTPSISPSKPSSTIPLLAPSSTSIENYRGPQGASKNKNMFSLTALNSSVESNENNNISEIEIVEVAEKIDLFAMKEIITVGEKETKCEPKKIATKPPLPQKPQTVSTAQIHSSITSLSTSSLNNHNNSNNSLYITKTINNDKNINKNNQVASSSVDVIDTRKMIDSNKDSGIGDTEGVLRKDGRGLASRLRGDFQSFSNSSNPTSLKSAPQREVSHKILASAIRRLCDPLTNSDTTSTSSCVNTEDIYKGEHGEEMKSWEYYLRIGDGEAYVNVLRINSPNENELPSVEKLPYCLNRFLKSNDTTSPKKEKSTESHLLLYGGLSVPLVFNDEVNPMPAASSLSFKLKTGFIYSGFLEERKTTKGMWTRRYFALQSRESVIREGEPGTSTPSELNSPILLMFSTSAQSAWGEVGLGLKQKISCKDIVEVSTDTTVNKKGKEFFIKFKPQPSSQGDDEEFVVSSESNSQLSCITLRADNATLRMNWVSWLEEATRKQTSNC